MLHCCQFSARWTAMQPASRPTSEEREGDVTATLASPLTIADRCDRCGAQAYVRVMLVSGGELLFCAHHGREHTPALADLSASIQDESERLQQAPTHTAEDSR